MKGNAMIKVSTRSDCDWFTISFQVILGIVDAAYSGDWSRIGVITKGGTFAEGETCERQRM